MELLKAHLLSAALIVGVAAIGLVVTHVTRKHLVRILRDQERLGQDRRQQAVTLVGIAGWLLTVIIVGAAILMLLSEFGVDISPLLASAGIAGIAVSLGAQNLIKDLIGGFFILAENQYSVGDTIQVGPVSGQVERLTLRTTCIRDQNGHLCTVPNGDVRIVSNQTREWSRALVEVSVAYEQDLDRALRALQDSADGLAADPNQAPHLLEKPQVLGPVSLDPGGIRLRMMVKTQPGRQWEVARELQRRILAAFEREEVVLPSSPPVGRGRSPDRVGPI